MHEPRAAKFRKISVGRILRWKCRYVTSVLSHFCPMGCDTVRSGRRVPTLRERHALTIFEKETFLAWT